MYALFAIRYNTLSVVISCFGSNSVQFSFEYAREGVGGVDGDGRLVCVRSAQKSTNAAF
jgi:hypothetical protein